MLYNSLFHLFIVAKDIGTNDSLVLVF